MACVEAFKHNPGCPECGPDDEVVCGVPCPACGGTSQILTGFVVDDHGTWPLKKPSERIGVAACPGWNPPQLSMLTTDLLARSGLHVFKFGECDVVQDVYYMIGVSCNSDGTIAVRLHAPFLTSCGVEPVRIIQLTRCPVVSTFPVNVTPVCDSDTIVATAYFPPIDYGDGVVADDRVISFAEVTLFVEKPKQQVCCSPYPIPKSDLSATVDGSPTTLAWNGSVWTDGVYTLSCSAGLTQFAGPGSWSMVQGAASPSPIHLEFSGTSYAVIDGDALPPAAIPMAAPPVPSSGVVNLTGRPRIAIPARCKWLDRLCGCQWGTCTHPEHERCGKEVGHRDCDECPLREVANEHGSGQER